MARLPRRPCVSPLPETTTGRASPGPVMLAWDGPFASAGAARVIAAAMLMPAVRAVTTIILRSMAAAPSVGAPLLVHRPRAPGSRSGWRGGSCRAGDGERGCLAEVAFQAQRDLPGAPDQGVAGGEP